MISAGQMDDVPAEGIRTLQNGGSTYRLLQLVGRGGFGEVYKALHVESGEYVAVKHLLHAEYGDRFRREARTMLRFSDSCFTRFVDYFEQPVPGGAEAFLVMEYLPGMPGSSLSDVIRKTNGRGLPGNGILKAFVRYARGLAVLHRNGVYHRDIKPSNLYYPVGRPDKAVVMDLGIIRDVNGTVTTGRLMGTFEYMPPEAIEAGGCMDAAGDIYALGLCLYEALTGKTGYPRLSTGTTALAAFYRRASAHEPPVFDAPEIVSRPRLQALLFRMTDPDRSRRLSDAGLVAHILSSMEWNTLLSERVRSSVRQRLLTVCSVFFAAVAIVSTAFWLRSTAGKRTVPRGLAPTSVRESPPASVTKSDPEPMHVPPPPKKRIRLDARMLAEERALSDGLVAEMAKTNRVRAARIAERCRAVRAEADAAEEDAERILLELADEGLSADGAARLVKRWSDRWRAMSDRLDRARIHARLTAACAECRRRENGRDVISRCRQRLAAIGMLSDSDVGRWRERLTLARQELDLAVAATNITRGQARTLLHELAAAERWTVGAVDNRLFVPVELLGEKVPPFSMKTFVFTNGLPENAVVTVNRSRSLPVARADLDGRVFSVTEQMLVRVESGCSFQVPPLPRGVVCLIDGQPFGEGEALVGPGRHTCVFRHTGMTYEGVRDFMDNTIVEEAEAGRCVELPLPTNWIPTREYERAAEAEVARRKGDELFDTCLGLLDVQPIKTRNERIARARRLLADYGNCQKLGMGRTAELNMALERSRDMVAGFVENATDIPLTVDLCEAKLDVPAFSRALVVCPQGIPVGARVSVVGFRPVPLPRADALNGMTFSVAPDRLMPLPVSVSLPRLEGDVICLIAGREAKAPLELLPGRYVCTYFRDGFARQRVMFDVCAGRPMVLDPPGDWSAVREKSCP